MFPEEKHSAQDETPSLVQSLALDGQEQHVHMCVSASFLEVVILLMRRS